MLGHQYVTTLFPVQNRPDFCANRCRPRRVFAGFLQFQISNLKSQIPPTKRAALPVPESAESLGRAATPFSRYWAAISSRQADKDAPLLKPRSGGGPQTGVFNPRTQDEKHSKDSPRRGAGPFMQSCAPTVLIGKFDEALAVPGVENPRLRTVAAPRLSSRSAMTRRDAHAAIRRGHRAKRHTEYAYDYRSAATGSA